ncbi:MAG: peptidylprolyl isomerase [Treponema sp.]|jgi:hypothetical protein|nr:peptidylprolyl isomerase [Treponema sp.]
MAKAKKREQGTGAEELFRRLKSNPPLFIGTVLVLVIVIVAFVFVPAIPDFGAGENGNDYIFGYYGATPITYLQDNYFGRNLDRLADMYRFYGFSLEGDYSQDPETSRIANMVWQETFYMTLTHEAILDEMKNAGYKAPAAQIDREMTKLAEFLENGRFSITKYRSYNKNTLLSMWQETEENYTEQQYKNAYNSLLISSAEKKLIEDMSSPERIFRMALFPRTSYPDSEVASYGASNPAPFTMVHLSKIVIGSSEREAAQIRDSVLNGRTNFEDAARTQSTDVSSKDQGGDMGIRMAYDIYNMIPDEGERTAVLSLKNGEYSQIVKDPNGWAFYRAEADPYIADLSQSDNLGKVRSYMAGQAGGVIEGWLVERAEEFISLSREAGFEQAALETGIEVKQFGPVSLNYGNVQIFNTLDSGDIVLVQAVSNENFWRTAFTIPVNAPSSPFTLGTDVVVLEAVDETIKTDEDKIPVSELYAGFREDNMNEVDIRTAITGSEKTRDDFFLTYLKLQMLSNVNG